MSTFLRMLTVPIGGGLLFCMASSFVAFEAEAFAERPWGTLSLFALVVFYALLSVPFLLPKEIDTSLVGLSLLAVAAAISSSALSARLALTSHLHAESMVPAVFWLTALLFHGELESALLRNLLTLPAALSAMLAVFGTGAICLTAQQSIFHGLLTPVVAGLSTLALLTFLTRELASKLERPAIFALYCGFLPIAVSIFISGTVNFSDPWLAGFVFLCLILGSLPVLISFLIPAYRPSTPAAAAAGVDLQTETAASEVLVCYTCRCGKRTFLPVSELEPGLVDCCGGRSLELIIRRLQREPAGRSSPQPP